jgi:peptide/nickel transport system ATP-binding protein
MSAPLLEVEDLTTHFVTRRGVVRALDRVSFSIQPGQVVGLVGESGSGKSTVALSILRLIDQGGRIAQGTIRFAGHDLVRLPERELRELRGDRLAMVFQDPLTSLTPSLRIGEQLAEMLLTHRRVTRDQVSTCVVELLEQVGVPEARLRARQYPHQFSGGMRQRVSIALALSCQPDVVILDEPTTALDVTIQAQILDLLEHLRDQLGLAMLFITHDLGVIVRICDAVCVLYGGRVVEQAPTGDLFQRPLHPYTKGLLASVPDLSMTARGHRLPSIPGRVPDLVSPPDGCIFEARCPFAERRCREPQVLLPVGDGQRTVACWKYETLTAEPWPVQRAARGSSVPARSASSLAASGLVKEFQLTGFWDSLGLVRGPGRLPRIMVEPRKLRAVDGVSLTIARGETLGLVGESGCGKSTLGRMMIGLVTPTTGEIWLDGRDRSHMMRADLRRYRKDVQIIFQNPESSLNPRRTIGEIVARPLVLYGLTQGRRTQQRVFELLETVQLSPEYVSRYPHQLSGGEKQRVGIARALASEPRFIICDEPISALDVSVRASILNLLDDLKEQFGLSYLFIAHDLAVVKHISDRIAVMYRGRIVEVGTVQEIFSPPFHPYTQALLSAIPIADYAERRRTRIHLQGTVRSLGPAERGCCFRDRCPLKIGAICDEVAPPIVEVSPGHQIACHHDLAFLRTLEPSIPATGDVPAAMEVRTR